MDGWEIGLLAVAGFVAVTSLVRLMKHRHDALVSDMRSKIEGERRRKAKRDKARQRRQRTGTPRET